MFSSLGTSDIQGRYSPRELIYTLILIHGRDPIPCRTTYIEYKSQGEDSLFFYRNTTQFHWFSLQSRSFSLFYGTGRGGNLRWAWKTNFFSYKTKRNWSFRVTWCFFSCSSSGTSDIQGRYSPKGIDLYPYTWKRPNFLQNYIHRI